MWKIYLYWSRTINKQEKNQQKQNVKRQEKMAWYVQQLSWLNHQHLFGFERGISFRQIILVLLVPNAGTVNSHDKCLITVSKHMLFFLCWIWMFYPFFSLWHQLNPIYRLTYKISGRLDPLSYKLGSFTLMCYFNKPYWYSLG